MPGEFQERYREWVTKIFDCYPQECLSRKAPVKLLISEVCNRYFQTPNYLSRASLDGIRKGQVCKPRTIRVFSLGLDLTPVDRSELLIRWGEAYLKRYAFHASEGRVKSFRRDWKLMPSATAKELKLDFIDPKISPRTTLANGITAYLKACGISRAQIRSVPYSTISRFSTLGTLRPVKFNDLLNELNPVEPGHNATPQERSAYLQLELTHEKICANYIAALLDFHILDLQVNDLLGGFDPDKHARLAAWLVRIGLPILEDSQVIDTLYLE